MPSAYGYKYPLPGSSFGLGKLPPIRRKTMDRPICVGRVWIFLILGVILFVLGLVSVGVYFNLDAITNSREYVEVMPPLVNIVSILLSGIAVCSLFWKRLKVLVLLVVGVCIATGLLCGATAVLNMTHILQPIQSFTNCRYYLSQQLCQCFSPYARDLLSLDHSETELTKYDFKDAGSCTSIQEVLPQLLYTLIAVYAIVLLVCTGSIIVALLVLRIETNKRNCFQDENYEEVYTVSGSSVPEQSDSEPEIITTNQDQGQGSQNIIGQATNLRGSNTDTINSIRSVVPSINSNRSVLQTQNVGQSTTSSQSSLQNSTTLKTVVTPRSKTPGLNDLGKESLANRYKINKTPDREVTFRHRVSKTPDREVGSRRRNSLNLSKRLSKSCDSLESSGKESSEPQEFDTVVANRKGKGRLKEHRRKGKRAATVHTLDRDQLLLILSLQMRYLQESQEKELKRNSQVVASSRRAITPQPASQKQVIPQKVRSHTPQPYRANSQREKEKEAKEKEFYDQIETLLFRSKQKEQQRLNQNQGGLGKKIRKVSGSEEQGRSGVNSDRGENGQIINDKDIIFSRQGGLQTSSESYLTSQQIYRTTPPSKSGHMPYSGPSYNSADSVHYITYSDNMLRKLPKQPQSRPSVRNSSLPPEPLRRGVSRQLPPRPISRQQYVNQPLQPEPIHRGYSAFQIVDRSSKSRSPSVSSDHDNSVAIAPGRIGSRKDQADFAIRENFQMNPSPYMLQNTNDPGRNPTRNLHHTVNENVKMLTGRNKHQTPSPDILPPYSGPPSYHEYVSSCEHSMTSSLSSNPDDIYTLPKRHVSQEEQVERITANHNTQVKAPANQNGFANSKYESEHIYGNVESFQNFPNDKIQRGQGKGSSITNENNANFNSPSRSRVKQFIVPEDYYTPIHQIQRQKEKIKYQNKHGQVQFDKRQDPFYGNISEQKKFYLDEVSSRNQIAPDEKYHEYEDVYETVSPPSLISSNVFQASVPNNGQKSATNINPYQQTSITNHGFETPNYRGKQKKKSRDKSPMKSKLHCPVSNVNARVLDFTQASGSGLNDHMTPSVQNVHAGNLRNIPKIKLNGEETEDDDEVFTDGDLYGNNFDLLRGPGHYMSKQKRQGQLNDKYSSNIDNCKNLGLPSQDKNRTNGDLNQGSEIVTNSGYMKMTLPATLQHQREVESASMNSRSNIQTQASGCFLNSLQGSSMNETSEHMTGSGNKFSNHVTGSATGLTSHMTKEDQSGNDTNLAAIVVASSSSENERQVPEGNDSESGSIGECEETGV